MPGCNQTLAGLAHDCEPSMGGILELLLANKEDVTAVTVSDTTHQISAITMATSAKFKTYYFNPETGNFTSTYQINKQNGVRFVQSLITLLFGRMNTAKRIEMTALAQNDLVAIVKDANGAYWYFGYDEPVTAQSATGQTGTARTDRNGYDLTLVDNSLGLPYEVDPDIIEDLV